MVCFFFFFFFFLSFSFFFLFGLNHHLMNLDAGAGQFTCLAAWRPGIRRQNRRHTIDQFALPCFLLILPHHTTLPAPLVPYSPSLSLSLSFLSPPLLLLLPLLLQQHPALENQPVSTAPPFPPLLSLPPPPTPTPTPRCPQRTGTVGRESRVCARRGFNES